MSQAYLNRTSKYEKGSFILYDKLSGIVYPESRWNFLYNPDEIVNESAACYVSKTWAGGNFPCITTSGMESDIFRFKLMLTGDNVEAKYRESDTGDYTQKFGISSVRVTPFTTSDFPQNSNNVPDIFTEFGKRNMTLHCQYVKSMMMSDPNREWRIMFDYGSIIAAEQPPVNVYVLTKLTTTYMVCDSDLSETILASLEVELSADSTIQIDKQTWLNRIKSQIPLNPGIIYE